jgi:hypothetical protein
MTERGPINKNEPVKLTATPPADRLNGGGDIYMDEHKGDAFKRGGMPSAKDQQRLIEAGEKLVRPGKGATAEEIFAYDYFRRALSNMAGVPVEKNDKSEIAKPLPTERQKEVDRIIDDPKNNFYDAFEKIISTSSPEAIKAILEHQGQAFIGLLVTDLPDSSRSLYLSALKGFSSLDAEVVRAGMVDIVNRVRVERKVTGLPDPLASLDAKHGSPLSKKQRADIEQTQAEGERRSVEEDEEERAKVEAEELSVLKNLAEDQKAAVERVHKGERYGGEAMAQSPYGHIDSVQELAKWIIKNQDSRSWGADGAYPLLDEKGELNQANFMIWLRAESVKHHKNNANAEMTPLSSVGIATDYREISVYAISLLQEQYLKDKANNKEVLRDLADQLIMEGFMFGELRNMELKYRLGMGDPEKIKDLLDSLHMKNTLTRPGNLKLLMNMAEDFTDKEEGKDTRVGDTFRNALDIYYNISDAGELSEIFKNNKITKEDFIRVLMVLNDEFDWDTDKNMSWGGIFYEKGRAGSEFFYMKQRDEGGEPKPEDLFINGEIDLKKFADIMNFYKEATPEDTKMDFIKEFVRQKAAQKAGLKRTGFLSPEKIRQQQDEYEHSSDKAKFKKDFLLRRKAGRFNMEYAEILAFSMQRPYGNAAKQDLGRAAYDFMTRLHTSEYLLKLSGDESGGAIGIPEQLGLFRDLAPDMMAGIRTEGGGENGGKTIYEIMKALRNLEAADTARRTQLIDELKFKNNAEAGYTTNEQKRAIEIYKLLSDAKAFNLDKIVTWSYLEGIKYDVAEFQKQINEGLIKHFKYAFINAGVNYGEDVRIYDAKTKTYTSGSLAERTLGPGLFKKLTEDYATLAKENAAQASKNGEKPGAEYASFDTFLSSREARVRMAKIGSLGIIAAQLRHHNSLASLGKNWGYVPSEMFIDALKTIQQYDTDPVTGREFKVLDANGKPKRYYSEADIAWLRKQSGTEVWRMMLKETGKEGGAALFGGLIESLVQLMGDMSK